GSVFPFASVAPASRASTVEPDIPWTLMPTRSFSSAIDGSRSSRTGPLGPALAPHPVVARSVAAATSAAAHATRLRFPAKPASIVPSPDRCPTRVKQMRQQHRTRGGPYPPAVVAPRDLGPSERELLAHHCWEVSDEVPGRPEMSEFRRRL